MMSKWQTIDTAPVGVHILAWEPGAHRPYIAHYDAPQWWTDADEFNDYTRSFPPTCEPTHWMPLPNPPKA